MRHKTAELIVESLPWKPQPRRRDDEIVAVRIAWQEADLRDRAKRLGAVWRPAQKIWEMRWGDVKRLELQERVEAL